MFRPATIAVGLFLLAFSTRALDVVVHHRHLWALEGGARGANVENERVAASVARDGTIGDVFADGSGPTAHLAPLYPWALGMVYRLAGPDWDRRRLWQELFSSAITACAVALLPRVARRAGLRPGVGLAAALVMALLPVFLTTETTGEHEQPMAALALLVLILDAMARRPEGRASAVRPIFSGVLIGLAALLNPTVALAGLAMRAAIVLGDRESRWRSIRSTAVVCLVVASILTPWALRNRQVLGGFVPLRSNLGLELYVGNHDEATGYFRLVEPHPIFGGAELEEYKRLGELAYMKRKMATATRWIVGHPARFAQLTLARVNDFWFGSYDFVSRSYARAPWLVSTLRAYFSAVSLLAFCGLGTLYLVRSPSRWVLASALLVPGLAYYFLHVMFRYRYPIYPVCLLLAGEAVFRAVDLIRGRPQSLSALDGGVGDRPEEMRASTPPVLDLQPRDRA